MSRIRKLTPPKLDQEITKLINLTFLRRIDPFIQKILFIAAHVAVYEFNTETQQWSRKNVEGPLFVVKRTAQPRFQFIVLNQHSTDNLVLDLSDDLEYEVQVPYFLYQNSAREVNVIWFYNLEESEAVENLLGRTLKAYSNVPLRPKVSTTQSSEFNKLEGVPSLDVTDGPLEPPSSASASLVDALNSLFSANEAIAKQSQPSSPTIPPPSLPTVNATLSSSPLVQSAPSLPTSSSLLLPNLVKPCSFLPPFSSSLPFPSSALMAPPLHPPMMMQTPYVTHLPQLFPQPIPPPSLTHAPSGPVISKDKVRDALHLPMAIKALNVAQLPQPFTPPIPLPSLTHAPNGPTITKGCVRDALLRLMQSDRFIDMVYMEILDAHRP